MSYPIYKWRRERVLLKMEGLEDANACLGEGTKEKVESQVARSE